MTSPVSSWRILVAGAAGAIGSGIVTELVGSGARVVAVDRDETGLRRLKQQLSSTPLSRLSTVGCDLAHADRVAELARHILSTGEGLDALVCCLGLWWETGRLREVEILEEWERVARSTIVPQLLLTRAFVPVLARNDEARCLWINGGTAETPQPGAGLSNLASAAQLMLARVLSAEEERLHTVTLLLEGPVRSRKMSSGEPDWMDDRGVGAACVRVLGAKNLPRGAILRAGNRTELHDVPADIRENRPPPVEE
jgi:NAD(P)-dependent dehydrogenase (short-subunit alcohol dehydrogenase family)